MEFVQNALDIKSRTARSYAFALNFCELLLDEFEEDLSRTGITRDSFFDWVKDELLGTVQEYHAEPEDHISVVTRWLRALLKLSDEWSVSESLNAFRLITSKKVSPPGRCLAVVNDPALINVEDELSIQMLGTLVAQYGGVRSHDAMLKRPSSVADYVNLRENGRTRKCTLIPFSLIKSDIWIALCYSKYKRYLSLRSSTYFYSFPETGTEDWIALADVDTPSGVMESTRISQEVHDSRIGLSSTISNITRSDKSGETNEDREESNNTQRSQMQEESVVRTRQTPSEITAALSAAVGELDLEDFETISHPAEGNVDGTIDYTQFGSHHHISGSANNSTLAGIQNQSTGTKNNHKSEEDTVSQPPNTQRKNISSASSQASSTSRKGPFLCSACGKECANKAGLKSHERKHK